MLFISVSHDYMLVSDWLKTGLKVELRSMYTLITYWDHLMNKWFKFQGFAQYESKNNENLKIPGQPLEEKLG